MKSCTHYDLKAKQLKKRSEYGISKPVEGEEGTKKFDQYEWVAENEPTETERMKKQSKQKTLAIESTKNGGGALIPPSRLGVTWGQ